ncbi:MAG TPA: TIGR03560 family F420-dependent LLM class oxidoreductase [Streptosporangiaceae bacterium]|nr:TIGR03560 family F420-dependent LLM class oxidoreductase [Streptosporangiaceae bacterium]
MLNTSRTALFRRGMHFGSYGSVDDGRGVFDRLGRAVEIAEAAGFDALSVPDHLQQNAVGGGPASPMFEAYTALGALAMRTTSARLLALVSPVTLRNPALLAKAVTTLDVLSGGRAVLGVGAGWDAAEHDAYGFPFPAVGERMDRLDETLEICRALFRQEWASVEGAHYAVRDAPNSPRPVAGSIPILVAGGGERRTLDLAARYGDACNVLGDAATVRHKFDVLEQHCDRVGRDPAELTKTVFVLVPDDLAEFAAQLGALAAVGADAAIVLWSAAKPDRIPELGQILAEVFPG